MLIFKGLCNKLHFYQYHLLFHIFINNNYTENTCIVENIVIPQVPPNINSMDAL